MKGSNYNTCNFTSYLFTNRPFAHGCEGHSLYVMQPRSRPEDPPQSPLIFHHEIRLRFPWAAPSQWLARQETSTRSFLQKVGFPLMGKLCATSHHQPRHDVLRACSRTRLLLPYPASFSPLSDCISVWGPSPISSCSLSLPFSLSFRGIPTPSILDICFHLWVCFLEIMTWYTRRKGFAYSIRSKKKGRG